MIYEIKYMPGDRTNGFYYFSVKDTDLILCEDGHPNFPKRFELGEMEAAKIFLTKLNRL